MREPSFKHRFQARAAAWRHARPSKKIKVILVVGQDGGASTAATLAAMLRAAGEKVGVITGQFAEIGDERVLGSDRADILGSSSRLQGMLAQIRGAGCTFAILEVPSELPKHQFSAVEVHTLVIRRCGDNYLGSAFASIMSTKLKTLLGLQPQFVIYNRDDPLAHELAWLRGHDGVMSFGTHIQAECQIRQVKLHLLGTQLSVVFDHQTPLVLASPQAGKQAVYNLAAAAATAYVLGLPVAALERGAEAEKLPLQLQIIPIERPYKIIVDNTTTPTGLAESLELLKHCAKNRLLVVYGPVLGAPSNSLPPIGELLASQADRLILTDGEYTSQQSPKQLRELVWQGVNAAGGDAKTEEIADRQAAIEKVVSIARRGDVILIAGASAHPYRQMGEERRPWSDIDVITQLFEP